MIGDRPGSLKLGSFKLLDVGGREPGCPGRCCSNSVQASGLCLRLVVRPHRSYRASGGLHKGQPCPRQKWIACSCPMPNEWTTESSGFVVGKRSAYTIEMRFKTRSILFMWLGCRFFDTEVDCWNPGSICMLCPWARHFIRIASVDSAVK